MEAPHSPSSSGATMSQLEVEALLAQVEGGAGPEGGQGEKGNSSNKSFQQYEFKQNSLLSGATMRKLRLRNEEYVNSLAAQLSSYLRLEFSLQMSKLETVVFPKFVESLADPTHLVLFKMEPLDGICYLEIPPRLGMSIVDRRMGGPGNCPESVRNLTRIEIGLLEQPSEIVVKEWCNTWSVDSSLRPMILDSESNGRFLGASATNAVMLLLAMEARIAGTVEQMQIGFPLTTLKPMLAALDSPNGPEKNVLCNPTTELPKWNSSYDDLSIEIAAMLPTIDMTTQELVDLQVGTFIPFKRQTAKVFIENEPKFSGDLGHHEGFWAVRLGMEVQKGPGFLQG